jgi:hypothetical protein
MKRILLIEDDTILRESTVQLLELSAYDFCGAFQNLSKETHIY